MMELKIVANEPRAQEISTTIKRSARDPVEECKLSRGLVRVDVHQTYPSESSHKICSDPTFNRLPRPPEFSLCLKREMRMPAATEDVAVRPQ
jgi:hypothetical protein